MVKTFLFVQHPAYPWNLKKSYNSIRKHELQEQTIKLFLVKWKRLNLLLINKIDIKLCNF